MILRVIQCDKCGKRTEPHSWTSPEQPEGWISVHGSFNDCNDAKHGSFHVQLCEGCSPQFREAIPTPSTLGELYGQLFAPKPTTGEGAR